MKRYPYIIVFYKISVMLHSSKKFGINISSSAKFIVGPTCGSILYKECKKYPTNSAVCVYQNVQIVQEKQNRN